jgi:hypothetical protein
MDAPYTVEEEAAKRLHDEADRAIARGDRLQQILDRERCVTASLRKQLRATALVQQQLTQQVRSLTGPVSNLPPRATSAQANLTGLQRTLDAVQNRLDVEKRASNVERAERQRLASQLVTSAAEKQRMSAMQDQLRVGLQRKSSEFDRASAMLRDNNAALDEALSEVSKLSTCRAREQQQAKAHLQARAHAGI